MYLWAADLHFDTARILPFDFGRILAKKYANVSGLILTGDISTAKSLKSCLIDLQKGFDKKVYFVLGNHDYWGNSFLNIDIEMSNISDDIIFLNTSGPIKLNKRVWLVGTGGWYDCGYGSDNGREMEDFYRIEELSEDPINKSKARAAYLADQIERQIDIAMNKGAKKIVVATHVPPFEELAQFGDLVSFYGSSSTGIVLDRSADIMKEMIVLCGHVHCAERYSYKNIIAYSGESKRVYPVVAGLLNEEDFSIKQFYVSSSSSGNSYEL